MATYPVSPKRFVFEIVYTGFDYQCGLPIMCNTRPRNRMSSSRGRPQIPLAGRYAEGYTVAANIGRAVLTTIWILHSSFPQCGCKWTCELERCRVRERPVSLAEVNWRTEKWSGSGIRLYFGYPISCRCIRAIVVLVCIVDGRG